MTVDVEEWFDGAGRPLTGFASRLERQVEATLECLAGTRATFFTLGYLTKEFSALIRKIADAGHEVGCHGWEHDFVYGMSREEFRTATHRAKNVLEQAIGGPVRSYRAAYFSVTRASLWALEELAASGFEIDASIAPVRHYRYGIPGFPGTPVWIETPFGTLLELPVTIVRRLGVTMPAGGGGYFRLFPLRLTLANLRNCVSSGTQPVFYFHPWELDPDHPRVRFGLLPTFTHYYNLKDTRRRLASILAEFETTTVREAAKDVQAPRIHLDAI